MAATGVRFEKSRVEQETRSVAGGWVFRMEPPLDVLGRFETMTGGEAALGVRYAVRQVLEAEWRKENVKRGEEARRRRMGGKDGEYDETAPEAVALDGVGREELKFRDGVKRDFFGRVVKVVEPAEGSVAAAEKAAKMLQGGKAEDARVWVSFHEGFSNAVRKPISFKELMDGL